MGILTDYVAATPDQAAARAADGPNGTDLPQVLLKFS